MWVTRKSSAPRVVSRRIVSLLAVSLTTALFAVLGPLTQLSFAEPAEWNGQELYYEGNQYEREDPNPLPPSDGRGRAGEVAYTWVETTSDGDQKAHTIFFENDSQIQAKDTAVLIVYDYEPPNTYTNASSPETIELTANLLGGEVDNEQGGSTCSGDTFMSLGWFLCPVSMWLSEGVDWFYGIIRQFLEVPLATTDDSSGMYALWKAMRTIANVAFVIAFLVIIYSQLTSIGISNYSIKAMMPRLIIAALLVNVSYFICSIVIDIFNVLGHSFQAILENIRENISITNTEDLNWSSITNFILSGGVAAGAFFTAASFVGDIPAMGLALLIALISVMFAIFVAFVILAARQALITILVVIAPLAFVAYLLPNTEQYFKKWAKGFLSLLMFFPIFSLLFGGSQLAGLVIIQRGIDANQLHIVLLGMVVQFVPLFITPLLLQFSTGLLGRIAGMANNANKGPIDGLKNNLQDRIDERKAKSLAKDRKWYNPNLAARTRQAMYKSDRAMEKRKQAYEKEAAALADRSKKGVRAYELGQEADQSARLVEGEHETGWKRRMDITDDGFDPSTFNKEHAIQRTADKKAILDDRLAFAQSEMHAGVNPYTALGMEDPRDETLTELTDDFARNADLMAAAGTRKAFAERRQKELLAERVAKNEIDINGIAYQEYASGIMGDSGMIAVKAQAEAESDRIMQEDIKNIHSTFDSNFSFDAGRTMDEFTNSQNMSERVALMMTFAKQGSAGDENIRKALKHMDALYNDGNGTISNKELAMFKGMAGSMVPNIRAQGEDVKRWLGNVSKIGPDGKPLRDADGNAIPKSFTTLGNDVQGVLTQYSPASFVASAPIMQRHTLRMLAQHDPNRYNTLIKNIKDNQLWGDMKDKVLDDLVLDAGTPNERVRTPAEFLRDIDVDKINKLYT